MADGVVASSSEGMMLLGSGGFYLFRERAIMSGNLRRCTKEETTVNMDQSKHRTCPCLVKLSKGQQDLVIW